MLHAIGSLLGIIANRSRCIQDILDTGRGNINAAPKGFRELCWKKKISGCFHLPFMGSELENRSWLSKFIFGYTSKHACWFGYSPAGIVIYVDDKNQKYVEKHDIIKIKSNFKDGSLIVLTFRSPWKQTIYLKFGGESSAIKICEYLQDLLKSDAKLR